ncbi:MAG TPA: hypothetical protein VFC19_27440 [Candidatus Limnocylindrales bacterium]|nr:hypothetical protein [Candidatus Limnocylindrales bacterium]
MNRFARTASAPTVSAVAALGPSACGGGSMSGTDHGTNQPGASAQAAEVAELRNILDRR